MTFPTKLPSQDSGAVGVILEDVPRLRGVLPVVTEDDQERNLVFLGESQGSGDRIVVPCTIAND